MKTALFLFALLFGGYLLLSGSGSHKSKALVAAYHVSNARKTTSLPVAPVRIVVDKSNYELYVYDAKGWYATYPVVFGNNSLADKKMEGDRNTPEGTFKIASKRPHEKWSRMMLLDYPNQESLARFNQRKQRGEIPRNASPGGGIGIHGTWPRDDFMIDRFKNWTNGCISLKNSDVQELYSYIQIGTPITIQK